MPKDKYEAQELDSRYYLERLVDTGSFGAVYEARDRKLGRVVAVKILFDQDETAFRKEARLAVRFEHPNVVKVFDYGADATLNVGYIVMEFLNGRRLDQLISDLQGRVPLDMVAKFTDEIGSALQLAHERQLIHRDLKPRNVMLVTDGASDQRFVLLDLGLASQLNSTSTLRNQTQDGALSPHYASPEQFSQASVDYQSDVYSFGTILFELMTGEIPFLRDHLPALMYAICNEPAPRLLDVAPDRLIPDELDQIIRQCLEKDPGQRPESVRVVRETVLNALVQADPSITWRRSALAGAGTQRPPSESDTSPVADTSTLPPPAQGSRSRSVGQGSDEKNAWKGELAQRRARRDSSRSWMLPSVIVAMLVVAAVVMWPILPGILSGGSGTSSSPVAGKLMVADRLQLEAGTSSALQLYVEAPDSRTDTALSMQITSCPDWLKVTLPSGPQAAKVFDALVEAADSAAGQTGELVLTATIADWSESQSVVVGVTAPAAWPLPAGFTPCEDAKLRTSTVDGRTFFSHVERGIDGAPGLRIRFVLIDPPRGGARDRLIAPYYIMETKVWNALFAVWWQDMVRRGDDPGRDDWKSGATTTGGTGSIEDQPQLPVVRVTPGQAHQFAIWLTGGTGHLPSIEQWDLASGLRHWLNLPEAEQGARPEGPYAGRYTAATSDIAVNRRGQGPVPVGSSRNDLTLTGVRDIAGNGQEFTETLINGGRVGDVSAQQAGRNLIRVLLRGRSYLSSQPLRWEDLRQASELPDAIGYDESDPTISFRVVLETSN